MVPRYWIVVASRDHVQQGVAGGFAQACHGKVRPVKRMQRGDSIIYYSSKTLFGRNETCQRFTAIGEVVDDAPWQVEMENGFCPARRKIDFFPSTEASILPLIPTLAFIHNKHRWGGVFRFGVVEIGHADYQRIASAMQVPAGCTAPQA